MKQEQLSDEQLRACRAYFGDHDHLENEIDKTSPEKLEFIVKIFRKECICPPNGIDEACPVCIPRGDPLE